MPSSFPLTLRLRGFVQIIFIFLNIESKLVSSVKEFYCRWKSYFEPEKTILMTNVQDSVFQLFQRVENKVIPKLNKGSVTVMSNSFKIVYEMNLIFG